MDGKMSILELINILLKKDSYELLIWLQFIAKKMDCPDCIQVCVDKNKIPNCSLCIPPKNLIKKASKTLGKRRQQQNG